VKIKETSSRKEKAAETRNKIYKCAEQLFTKYGFDDVSVDAIVEMAGVSKGSFYVHFESKDSLIAFLIADYVKKIDMDYQSYFDSFPANAPAADILLALIEKIVDVITDTIGYDHMKTVYKVHLTKALNTDSVLSYNRDLYKMFQAVIDRGIQQGEFKSDLPIDILTKHFVMAIRGLTYEWCIRYPDFDYKTQALIHFEMLLTGIKTR